MRTTWNGSVSFGLVNIPVGLAPATKAAARQSDVSFRLLHRECGSPIKQKRWCPVHERDVESDELVKGWEVAKGQFVIVEDADLEAIEQHDTSRSIEISRFVRLEEVDPIYFDRTYFLVPGGRRGAAASVRAAARGDEGGRRRRARALRARRQGEAVPDPPDGRRARARDALRARGREGSRRDRRGRLGRRGEEARARPREADHRVARRSRSTRTELRSEYRESLRELLEAKLAGQEIETPEPAAPTPVVDLMEALRRPSPPRRRSPPRRKQKAAASSRKRRRRLGSSARQLSASSKLSAARAVPLAPGAAPGRASCRSCRGRSARAPRGRSGSPRRGRSRPPSDSSSGVR